MNTAPASAEPRWLTAEEQRVWRFYLHASTLLEDHLDRQLQRDAGMPHIYYGLLVQLAEGGCAARTAPPTSAASSRC
jgi:hypothetical protein